MSPMTNSEAAWLLSQHIFLSSLYTIRIGHVTGHVSDHPFEAGSRLLFY